MALVVLLLVSAASRPADAAGQSTTLWMSDLYRPAGDPDDHYDLAVGMASWKYRPSIVVIDRSRDPVRKPAHAAVAELARIAGVAKPRVVGDSRIKAQLDFLRASRRRSVNVVTLGSLSGLADLLKAGSQLLRRKVKSVMVFAGDASPGAALEYNVSLDPRAFVRVMTSGLNILWAPCFDGGPWQAGTSSFTITSDAQLLEGVSRPLFSWFNRHIGERFGPRNLWAAGLLSGERPMGARWQSVRLGFSKDGAVSDRHRRTSTLRRLTVFDRQSFESWMVNSTRRALGRLGY
jgi:hypothetical protein